MQENHFLSDARSKSAMATRLGDLKALRLSVPLWAAMRKVPAGAAKGGSQTVQSPSPHALLFVADRVLPKN